MLQATGDDFDGDEISDTADHYKKLSENFVKQIESLGNDEKIALLDSLADQIVTAVGVAHMFGMDISGALEEVNRSNFSKFENGKPVFDDNGKITKGRDYTPPNLKPYI